jgi:hypothetical protein
MDQSPVIILRPANAPSAQADPVHYGPDVMYVHYRADGSVAYSMRDGTEIEVK